MKHQRRKERRGPNARTAFAVAWYSPEDWHRLREGAADPEALETTYEEWVATANSALQKIRNAGLSAEKVQVNVDELISWCEAQGLALDGHARARYAAEKSRQRRGSSGENATS
jgi:hypothetical protein